MTESVSLAVGSEPWTFTLPAGKLLPLHRAIAPCAGTTPAELLQMALDRPLGLGAPMRSAVTPDDQDKKLRLVVETAAEVWGH